MSSPVNDPKLTPYVRGTTNAAVFFLQNGTARLVPDTATLTYMSAGQQVRTLSDADMAALPQGPPLPSRADGTLLIEAVSAATQAGLAFLMQGGLKRRIPDAQTAAGIENGGVQSHVIAPADAIAIPNGTPMPSRADGTVYQGTGGAFAFLLEKNLKSAVPDATTLRDAGHDWSTALPISANDLAAIPNGNPLPSTSKFLRPPSSSVPLLLLPVRLETRFQGSELWLRIYPDDLHVNSFEPVLTPDESSARTTYLAQAAPGGQAAQDAFTALAQQFGAERAAWIASANAQPGTKAAQWTQAPFTNVLPERWIVMGYQGNAAGQVLFVGSPIADSMPVGPDPNGPGLATDDGMRWVTDFDRAVQAGMACRIPLTGVQTRGFSRIVVFGLRSELDPAQAAARFGDLLQAHHYTDGFELLPHGAPTNNTETTSSALSTHDPNFAELFALEQGPPLCPARPTADGDRLARALSLKPTLLAHVRGADGGQDEEAAAVNTVLWPATWGYYLEQIVTGAVPSADTLLPLARDHFAGHVRARGHFPILRLGSQPYGVLPVFWSAKWASLEGRALDAPLMSLLARLRTTWENSVANVPTLHGAADPEAALVSLLGTLPSSTSYAARSVIGPEYNLSYWRFVQQDPGKTWWTTLVAKSVAQTGDLSTVMAATRLANATFVDERRPLTDILVAPAPLDGQAAPKYIAQLRGLPWQQLRDLVITTQPVALLQLLLRHAALRQYLDTAGELLATAGAAQPSELIEAEILGISAGPARPTAWDLLGRPYAAKGPVGTYLDTAKTDATLPDFAGFWSAFDKLATLTATALEFATREVMDLASYRLDAWVTSLAHYRLDQLRTATPNGGVILGAYGWLENVVPQNAVASAGYVHAPSLGHATTAAVLRSAYLTHRGTAQSPLQIGLSSDRVRLGLHLLDGVREGQTLGALLGYRLERAMHDAGAGLEPYIETLRAIAPLNYPDTDTTTSESVAPNNITDGLALLGKIFVGGTLATGFGLPTDPTVRANLTSVLQTLTDAVDAAADLTLSESVHQLLNGNTIRSGATLDAVARGDAPPPEFDVVQTPRSGTAVTHRLFAVASGSSASGWATTPRAQAEPRLNSWAASMFGDPTQVRIRAEFVDATAAAIPVEFGLDALALAPLDLLALPESAGLTGELGERLLRAAAANRPASMSAAATTSLVEERNPAWAPNVVSMTEFLQLVWSLSRTVSGARAMTPSDLVAQGDTPGGIDTAELQARADAAETQLRSAYTALQGTTGLDAALMTAANFAVTDAVPSADPTQWQAQASAAVTAIQASIAALDRLASGFTRAGASADASRDQDVARLQTIFGATFTVLPTLDAALTGSWPQLWSNSAALQAGDALASTTWFQRMARIRPGVSRLDTALLYAESLAGKTLTHFDVSQLPAVAGDRWVALPQSAAGSSGGLSLVAFTPVPVASGAPIAGLIIDEWVEVLPSAQQITGVAFHQDDPTARAPQTLLLAVRPDDFPEWTLESLEGTVLEALDLAKLRAVDPDALDALGHYLPALYFAYNAGGPQVDAVSTDFNVVRATTVLRSS
jgi:hypothetical protein